NRRSHAELARLVARRRNDAALRRIAADRDRLAAQRWIIALLDGRVERVHVDMKNSSHTPVEPKPPRVGTIISSTSFHSTLGQGRTIPCASRSPRVTFTGASVMLSTWILISSSGPQ